MNPEKIIFAPVETARMVGATVLWITDRLVPPEPSVETKAASITFYNTGEQE